MADMTSTNNFIATLSKTPELASELSANIRRLQRTNNKVIKYLGYIQTLADDLTELYDTLGEVKNLLTIVSVVPKVGQAASAFKSAITVMMADIKPAKDAAVRLAKTTKPISDALKELDPIFEKGIEIADEVAHTSTVFLEEFKALVSCINSLPESELKETAQKYLNQFSEEAEPIVKDLNTAMREANSVVNAFYDVLKEIQEALDPLKAIVDAVEEVLKVLAPIEALLKELENALKTIKILIPLPYPHMVSLYDIFKTLGDFINLAMKPIEDLVEELLKLLNVKLPNIPNLLDLIKLHIEMPDIPNFNALFEAIDQLMKELNRIFALLDLKCPPDPDQKEFNS